MRAQTPNLETPAMRRFVRAAHAAMLASASTAALVAVAAVATIAGSPARAQSVPPLPQRLEDTGLYSDAEHHVVAGENLPYSPQYPLWTDGAGKRRWIHLPPGTAIDAANVDAWSFPVGTKLWKEFSFGRPVETRMLERLPDGSWRYAAYAWSADGSSATLAPERGLRGVAEIAPGIRHDIPSRFDCGACHEGQATPVIGFSALQLSPDRDPLAPHADRPRRGDVDLRKLVRRGLVVGLPESYLRTPPRIQAPTPRERAVLGYLHGNCGHCHNDSGPLAEVGLNLAVRLAPSHSGFAGALLTAVGLPSAFPLPGTRESGLFARIAAGAPGESVLVQRMVSRQSAVQMPPLGTHVADRQALELVMAWIRETLAPPPTVGERVSSIHHRFHEEKQP